jgi:hypothetical protein
MACGESSERQLERWWNISVSLRLLAIDDRGVMLYGKVGRSDSRDLYITQQGRRENRGWRWHRGRVPTDIPFLVTIASDSGSPSE